MDDKKKHAERAVYKVLIRAPIETIWSEPLKTESQRPFFWNSKWEWPALAAGRAPFFGRLASTSRSMRCPCRNLEVVRPRGGGSHRCRRRRRSGTIGLRSKGGGAS
jgi:hypothetical protein